MSSPIVLSNRSIRPIYNIERIVDAIPLVLSKNENVTFVLLAGFGKDDYLAKIEDRIDDLGIARNIRIVPRMLSPREMAIANNMADAFISIPRSDQFGLTVLEAMACGSIPIVNRLPGYSQYLKDDWNALFVDMDDSNSIAEAILKALSVGDMKEVIFKRNLSIIEENENWNLNAMRMESLFKELISQ